VCEEEFQKAKKHKRCSPSLAINEMQIKTTLRFHLTLVRITTIKNTTTKKCFGILWIVAERRIKRKQTRPES
jgi:hypothetical protein